jgi:hypothetical protein
VRFRKARSTAETAVMRRMARSSCSVLSISTTKVMRAVSVMRSEGVLTAGMSMCSPATY